MLEPAAFAHRKWKKVLAWRLYQRGDLLHASMIHATSAAEETNLRARGFDNVMTIPNGTLIPAAAASFGGERRGVVIARLHPIKGLSLLIAAIEVLAAELRTSGWRFVIAGPDAGSRRELESSIARAGTGDIVDLRGEVDDEEKWRLLQSAHLFVLPSYSENFGMAIAEALATGVPVITTKGTPWREIEEQRCGWWVDANVEAITEALRTAIRTDVSELRAMGARGRALVSERYSWESVAEKFETLYRSLIEGGAA